MIYQFSVFFLNKNDENNENPFCGHCVGKYDPSTDLPRDFCAGIGPLQLSVVLVILLYSMRFCSFSNYTVSVINRISMFRMIPINWLLVVCEEHLEKNMLLLARAPISDAVYHLQK